MSKIIGNPITLGGKAPAPVGRSDVNFFDYDGSIVASYTAADFANLSAMPKNPTHDGLTAQGWNWTLADAKAYVASYGKLDVGQMYVTDDGKTRIYIRLEEGRLAPYLGIAINGTATVEWGDGQTSTVTGNDLTTAVNTQHTYASAGEYVIKIAVSGRMYLKGDSSYGSQVLWKNDTTGNRNRTYQTAIKKIEIGTSTYIDAYAFKYCFTLEAISIPSNMTILGSQAFFSCFSLLAFAIPSGIVSLSATLFQNCYSLIFVSLPANLAGISLYTFVYCDSLRSVAIPSEVYSLPNQMFYGCYSLESVVVPSSVKDFSPQVFYNCYSLTKIVIPDGTVMVESQMFFNCYSLSSIVIPSSVTRIEDKAFYNCYGLGSIMFASTTTPTVVDSNAWTNVPTDCVIYVPRGSLSAYTSAANYPSSSTYTYVEYDS